MKYNFRFVGGLIMIAAAAILMFINKGTGSTTHYIPLAVIGIVLVATAKRRMRKPPDAQ